MPPRRDTRSAAAAERATSALSPLPLSVVLHIFGLLPVDTRLRCLEVCRGWRSVLLERSLWTLVDVSRGARVHEGAAPGALDGLLRCASRRAGGGLQSLHVSVSDVTHRLLLRVAAANAGALRELHAYDNTPERSGFSVHDAELLLRAAPQLHVFASDVNCEVGDLESVRTALRNEAPFGTLRVRHLTANLRHNVDEAGVVAFAIDVAAHASLTRLTLLNTPLGTADALKEVVDAALARRMHTVVFRNCVLSPASAPALARLLGGGALTTLECYYMRLLDAPAAAVLAAALRDNTTLTSLTLVDAGVWRNHDAAAELLGALTGHASLRMLNFGNNHVYDEDRAAAGALLGALVAADAPALTELTVAWCWLGDAGLRPLFEALPHNTHLRKLECLRNDISEAFARNVLLPAVRANTSLQSFVAGTAHALGTTAGEMAAQQLVDARRS
jgi:hypothetical protein